METKKYINCLNVQLNDSLNGWAMMKIVSFLSSRLFSHLVPLGFTWDLGIDRKTEQQSVQKIPKVEKLWRYK